MNMLISRAVVFYVMSCSIALLLDALTLHGLLPLIL